ncbi:hypothetical protein CALVIDRAFT_489461 [Calocera viscosa TUFC12733]|uniref:Integrase core domain-containing protein n=1 Tax=Calocera viscosa (strain TUFC12733) TaxID=1330018 RepID=A0A167H2P9_CALVF|nr:hypothetical protein CALVIDRAFT_489461 [Calocera viscosa TUFC12733]
MVEHRGTNRGSYIWGRSVHNTRIERMWVDVTNSFGRKWWQFFHSLEAHHGLNHMNQDHVWLLHWLFLDDVNNDAIGFQNEWNCHTMSLVEGNQRPADLFLTGCLQHGARGIELRTEDDPDYYLDPPAYGVEDASEVDTFPPSFLGDEPPPAYGFAVRDAQGDQVPPRLSRIDSRTPDCPLPAEQLSALVQSTQPYFLRSDVLTMTERWRRALGTCARMGLS